MIEIILSQVDLRYALEQKETRMLRKYRLYCAVTAGFLLTGPVAAEGTMNHADHAMKHQADGSSSVQVAPVEPGQGAFAALAEIALILRSDPKTDWSKANFSRLRDHLSDMDDLVFKTIMTTNALDNGIRITLDLTAEGNAAAGRMVPAHAPVLGGETGWSSVVETNGTMISWEVTDDLDGNQIKALGFFGLMAMGDHHRAHHLAIAKGELMH